ncbi:hypothetical protein ABZ929_27460 [Streptomyces physcomitrii]|uniref:hypothetical protein n=1 Tax=Streptomyces physcomitrii TaxID=2724184 RepID=UPI00342A8C4F
MELDALRHANFALLNEAVSDWGTLVRHLDELKKDAEDGLHQAANKANWAGVNAQVSKEFIGKTAREFKDAHTQARTIHRILRDTRNELKQFKSDLEAAIDRGAKKNLTVVSTGNGGFTVSMNTHPDRAAEDTEVPDHDESDVHALRDEIEKILNKASTSDSSASQVLRAIADQAEMGFSGADYKDRDSAADALQKAEELARIAAKKPEDLTPEEFDRINKGLSEYQDDPLFSECFATRLGPARTLEFWAGLSDPAVNRQVGFDRRDDLDDLQRNLGMTLASASQSDSTAMATWKYDMVELGGKPLHGDRGGPFGFQVMSNLMRTGDYDDQFLKNYGTALMETDRKLTHNGEHKAWTRSGGDPLLNHIGDDSGTDPFTGYLKGLSNSPAAATDFFNQEYVAKEDSPFERDTDGNGKKGKVALTNFQYLFEERDWQEEPTLNGETDHTGRNNLALALEAATTGHPAGEMPTIDTSFHDRDQAKLFEDIVASIGDDPSRLTEKNYMGDSMGQMASEYLPDINRAKSDVDSDSKEDWENITRLFPIAGTGAELDHSNVTKFLFAVGQSPDGYAAVEVGQKDYMGKLMNYHLDPELPDDQRFPSDQRTVVQYISERSGEISGTLALGRQEAVVEPANEKDKEYDHRIAQYKNWISGGTGTAVGVGTSFIATPWIGAGVGGATSAGTSVLLEGVFQDAEGHAMADAAEKAGELWLGAQKLNGEQTAEAARAAGDAHHLKNTDEISTWSREAARQGVLNAQNLVSGQAPGSRTES